MHSACDHQVCLAHRRLPLPSFQSSCVRPISKNRDWLHTAHLSTIAMDISSRHQHHSCNAATLYSSPITQTLRRVDVVRMVSASTPSLGHSNKLTTTSFLHQWACNSVSYVDADNPRCLYQQDKSIPTETLKRHLQQCINERDLTSGRQNHSVMIVYGSDVLSALGSYLIHMFACCGSLLEANLVFSQMPSPCIVAWHAIIVAHSLLCQIERAIDLFFRMQEGGLLPSKRIVLCILGACTKSRKLSLGRLINDQIIKHGQSTDVAIASCLVDMYAKCGSVSESQKVFDDMPSRNVVTWNALIAGYAMAGQIDIVFLSFEKMQKEKIKPANVTLLCVLRACSLRRAIDSGNLIYDIILRNGFEVDIVVANSLIDLYAKCRFLQDASRVFETSQSRDVVSWNAIISGHVKAGHDASALELFKRMQKEGVNPDIFSFSCAFQACGSVDSGEEGKLLHNQLVESGLGMDAVIGGTLLNMYAKHGYLEEACQVFDGLPSPNNVLWGTMIAAYTQHAHYTCGLELFKRMQDECIKPDATTFPFILNCCACIGALSPGRVVHNQVLLMHLEAEPAIGNALIDMYGKCGSLCEARKVFNELPDQNVVSWNSLIGGYVQHEEGFNAMELFERMQQGSIEADKVTILGASKACASVGAVLQGRKLHFLVCYHGLESDVVLGSSMVDLYAKSGYLEDAYAVFRGLPCLDVVVCSAMIAGYAQQGRWFLAMNIYDFMVQKGIKPDNVSFTCILKACSQVGLTHDWKCIHNEVVRDSFDKDVLIGNTLIDMYAKCGRLVEAHHIFNALPEKSLASWNTIMTGYAQNDEGFQALELFERMPQERVLPNRVSFLSTLKACTSIGTIGHGLLMHDQIIRRSLDSDLVVSNSIIDMYAKYGSLQEAHKVFDGLPKRDVVSWSALIAGYAQHGSLKLAQHYLYDMHEEGVNPVSKTFTSILGACSNAGQVEEGHYYFKSMREEYGMTPSIEHCNCMIDILGRAGCVEDAKKFLQSMPSLPNITTWMSLLTSCRTFGSIEFGRVCFDQANKLNPYNSSAFMIMLKIYADANMWADVHKLEEARKQNFAWKKPGKACLEVGGKVHEFIAGERILECAESILSKRQRWTRLLKERGYLPESDSVLETEVDAVFS